MLFFSKEREKKMNPTLKVSPWYCEDDVRKMVGATLSEAATEEVMRGLKPKGCNVPLDLAYDLKALCGVLESSLGELLVPSLTKLSEMITGWERQEARPERSGDGFDFFSLMTAFMDTLKAVNADPDFVVAAQNTINRVKLAYQARAALVVLLELQSGSRKLFEDVREGLEELSEEKQDSYDQAAGEVEAGTIENLDEALWFLSGLEPKGTSLPGGIVDLPLNTRRCLSRFLGMPL